MCRIVASFDEDDIIRLFKTGIFNKFVTGYCKKALVNLEVDKKMINSVMDELSELFEYQEPKSILS